MQQKTVSADYKLQPAETSLLVYDQKLQLHEQGRKIMYMLEKFFFPSATYIIETPVSPLRLVLTKHIDPSGRDNHV